jgi:sulfatase modifying factor 1
MRGGALALCGALAACAAPTPVPDVWVEPITKMAFIRVDAGRFVMGSPVSEAGREPQEAEHEVTISTPFWMGAYEVTQEQWRRVTGEMPSHFADETRPVEEVTWHEAQAFLEALNAGSPDSHFRLPTEAEWEYACRRGSPAPYATGATLGEGQANVSWSADGVSVDGGGTTPVGTFPPNAWGFHDMHGNVWEWTVDEYCPYAGAATDPVGACGAPLKVIRGGSWYFGAGSARCALRYTHRPQDRGFSLGLRVVREEAVGR